MAFQFKNPEEILLNLQIKLVKQERSIGFDESEKFINKLLNTSD